MHALLVAIIIAASLSASDARPGQELVLSVGVEGCAGPISVEPAPGVLTSTATLTSTAHTDRNLAVQVLPDAWPGLRRLRVRCGDAATEVRLNVVHAGWLLFVPIARTP